jgi:hypothetical protein
MTTSGRISGDFLCLLYILSNRQAHNFFTHMGLLDPSPKAFKQHCGTYFYYNRAAIGLACTQATDMRIDIAPVTKRNRNSLFERRYLVWNTRQHGTRTNWLY